MASEKDDCLNPDLYSVEDLSSAVQRARLV